MEPAARREIDAYLSAAFGLPTEALHRPEVHVVPAATGDDGVVLFRIGLACVVVVEQEQIAATSAVVAALDPQAAFDRAVARTLAGDGAEVQGPAWHGYVDRSGFRGCRPADVERLDPADPRLLALRRACPLTEWGEAGFPMKPATADPARAAFYGISVDGELVAAGNLTDWRGRPADVGLLTRPVHRRSGLATRVAAATISEWLPKIGLVRYRALTTNVPSLMIARRLGFEGYGQNIFARRRRP